jgi:hypothetical protein
MLNNISLSIDHGLETIAGRKIRSTGIGLSSNINYSISLNIEPKPKPKLNNQTETVRVWCMSVLEYPKNFWEGCSRNRMHFYSDIEATFVSYFNLLGIALKAFFASAA